MSPFPRAGTQFKQEHDMTFERHLHGAWLALRIGVVPTHKVIPSAFDKAGDEAAPAVLRASSKAV
jgi:hypothetical protein